MVHVDGKGTPIASLVESASPAEVKLAERTLGYVRVPKNGPGRPRERPERVIADKAYDSDDLRARLDERGIELIVPHRENRKRPKIQDGRSLRRYKRRWIVERTISWIGGFRRLLIRWENKVSMFRAFLHVALLMLTLRRL